jgi:peroxiredoxin
VSAVEPAAPGDTIPVDPAVRKLDDLTSRMRARLKAAETFQVEATTKWTLDGATQRTGDTGCKLMVQLPDAFRLEVAPRSADAAKLTCASDGKTITRFYHDGRLAIFSREDGGLDRLLEETMTDGSLKGSGLDVVMRPDAQPYFMTSISEVKDCGDEEVNGRPAHHFSAAWFGGARIEVWIAAGQEPLLLRWRRTQSLDLGGQTHDFQVESEFTWKTKAGFSATDAVIQMPEDAIQVQDLETYLLKGGTDQLLGRPAPTVPLKLVDGSAWDLAKHRGKHHVVLFFFATWATPSTQDMPDVLAFVERYEDRGVVFYAVAVGEPPQTVRKFVESRKYRHPVVTDPDQSAATAYRVTSLPVTVLIGKDGTVQSAHVGFSTDDRASIRQDMEQLVSGKPLVER